jgi:hypothetical protein
VKAADDLETQATAFASSLTQTVRALVPDCPAFEAKLLADPQPDRERFSVRQNPSTGIPLRVDEQPILTLTVEYQCCLDGHQHYLAVENVHIKVYAGTEAKKEPLFRYHYRRNGRADLPSSHLHLHAHRDGVSHTLSQTGRKTSRGKARADASNVPAMAELHFPLGGHRFRPCLEDVLEMLVTEFGVDNPTGAIESLRDGRENWRRSQVRTVVRDAPQEAIRVLEDLGYRVRLPRRRTAPPENRGRLRAF